MSIAVVLESNTGPQLPGWRLHSVMPVSLYRNKCTSQLRHSPERVRSALLIFAPSSMRYVGLLEGAAQREKSQGSLPVQGRPRKASRGKKALSSQLSSAFSLSQSQSAAALVGDTWSEIQHSCCDVSPPHGIDSVCSACRGSTPLKS